MVKSKSEGTIRRKPVLGVKMVLMAAEMDPLNQQLLSNLRVTENNHKISNIM